jgi:hypothetical protein
MVVWSVLDKMPFFYENRWSVWMLSIIVSVLSIRFIEPTLIEGMLLPYSTSGIAITVTLPLAIYFIWVYKIFRSSIFRRMCFFVALLIFIGLYFTRREQLQDTSYIYLWGVAACILFIIFDKLIVYFWSKSHEENTRSNLADRSERHILHELNLLNEAWERGMDDSEYYRQKAHLDHQLEQIRRNRGR